MGKKIKPSNLLEPMHDEVLNTVQDNASSANEQEAFEDVSLVGNGIMTNEAKAKLEKYDALERSVADLSQEKDRLEAKVAEYVEKLESLKDASKTIEKLEAEVSKLKKDLDKAKKASKQGLKTMLENKALRDEADGYLVKISELTFDNANLTCQLDELKKNMNANGHGMNQAQFSPNAQPSPGNRLRHPGVDAYNPYKNNGYDTW